jgi:transcriptional regulator with XRE-family HTH domain
LARTIPQPAPTGSAASSVPIGARLKAARLARRKTLTEVALASGLTKSFISKLERDQANASVASLIQLCQVLDVSVASLFEADTGDLVRAGEYPPINFGGEQMSEYLLTPKKEQRLQAILSEIEPGGGSGDELYALPAEVEFAFVLSGELAVRLDNEEFVLREGDALTFSAQAHHAFRNNDAVRPARILWVYSPALPADAISRP